MAQRTLTFRVKTFDRKRLEYVIWRKTYATKRLARKAADRWMRHPHIAATVIEA